MNWSSAYSALSGEPAAQAALISLAWNCAAQSGNTGLLSNLLCNMMHPTGVCQSLDYAGEPIRNPRSLSFESLDEGEYQEAARGICRTIADRYWPNLSEKQIAEMAESFVGDA